MRIADIFKTVKGKLVVFVDNERVWDYKIVGKEFRLISEKVPGSEDYESVTLKELKDYEQSECPDVLDLVLVSETTGNLIIDADFTQPGRVYFTTK